MKHGHARWPAVIGAALIAACGLCGSAGADVSPSVIARVERPTSVAAKGDRVVFSRYVGRGRYRLVSVEGGSTAVLPVKSRRAAFDVDLGTDARGRVVATYSRCAKEPVSTVNRYLPAYVEASGCKLYTFDFTSQKERRLKSVSRGDTSDYLPSVSGGRVAFARIFERRRGLAGVLPYLYSARLDGTRLRRFAAGPRGEYSSDGGDFLRFTDANGPGPIRLELSGSTLAYSWGYAPPVEGLPPNRFCPMPVPDEEGGDSQIIFEIRVARLGQGSARRARACNLNDPTEVMAPVVGTGGSVLYATRYEGACFGTTITQSTPSGSRTLKVALPQQLPPEHTISLAGSSDRLILAATASLKTTIYDLGKPDFGLGTPGSLCP